MTLRGTTQKLTRLRKVVATRMVASLQEAAQLTTVVEVDVTEIAALRRAHKDAFLAEHGVGLSFLPFFAKAALEGLALHPVISAQLDLAGGTVSYPEVDHLGIAVDTEKGLFVPVLKEASTMSIAEIARGIDDLANRTRDGKVTADELGGGTFTITNTGSRGALFDTPIINQPQSAILGTGAVVLRPGTVRDADGNPSIALRSLAYLALSYDHRIVDGADAARYLSWVKSRLEDADFGDDLG